MFQSPPTSLSIVVWASAARQMSTAPKYRLAATLDTSTQSEISNQICSRNVAKWKRQSISIILSHIYLCLYCNSQVWGLRGTCFQYNKIQRHEKGALLVVYFQPWIEPLCRFLVKAGSPILAARCKGVLPRKSCPLICQRSRGWAGVEGSKRFNHNKSRCGRFLLTLI